MATTNFGWDEISESQSGKYATHNAALAQVDGKVGRYASVALSDQASNSLSQANAWQRQFLVFTGAMSQVTKVVWPGGGGTSGGGMWLVRDQTTGGYQITLGYATGNTCLLPIAANDSWWLVVGDTTNLYLMNSYAASRRNTTWSTSTIDFSSLDDFYVRAISTTLTLVLTNPILGRTIDIQLTSSASAGLNLPASVEVLSGTYDTTGNVNHVALLCVDSDTPKYLATISQEP